MVWFFLLWMVAFTLLKVLPVLMRNTEVLLLKGKLAKDILGWGLVCGVIGGFGSPYLTEEHHKVITVALLFPLGVQLVVTIFDFYWIAKRSQSPESTHGRRRLSDHLDWREEAP